MAVKDEKERFGSRAENPYMDEPAKSKDTGNPVYPTQTKNQSGNTSGGTGTYNAGAGVAAGAAATVPTDPGYVAPGRTLTMPESSKYDVSAPDPYNSRWQAQIDSLMGDIMNRKPFQYDLNTDALYQQAAQRYIQQGQMAMMDTMGQAAGLTGGYGNSYAQQAGQQAYQGYLQGLNDNIAQYYQMAYDRYNQEGQNMRNNLSMLNSAEDSDYGRYQDSYNQWYNERAHAENRADIDWERNYQYQKDQMAMQDDNYNRLASLISAYGYDASDEELAAAGMSRSIANTMKNAYIAANTPKATGGSYPKASDKTATKPANTTEKSVLELGYGPLSVDTVADLVEQGKVKVENNNGQLSFSKVATSPSSPSPKQASSDYFSNRVDPLDLLKNTKKK